MGWTSTFLYPLKASKEPVILWCFQGVKKETIGIKWVNKLHYVWLVSPNIEVLSGNFFTVSQKNEIVFVNYVFHWHSCFANSCQMFQGNLPTRENFFKCYNFRHDTAKKMTSSIKNFFSKCDKIDRKLQIWSHSLKNSFIEASIFVY